MFRRERTGHTQKHQYQDMRRIHMYRCPFKICGYSVINNKTIPGSIGAHLREYHSSTGRQYHVHYVQKGHSIVYQHGPRDTTQKPKEQMTILTHGT